MGGAQLKEKSTVLFTEINRCMYAYVYNATLYAHAQGYMPLKSLFIFFIIVCGLYFQARKHQQQTVSRAVGQLSEDQVISSSSPDWLFKALWRLSLLKPKAFPWGRGKKKGKTWSFLTSKKFGFFVCLQWLFINALYFFFSGLILV